MRIFLVLHPSGNLGIPNSMTWYRNLYEPLVDLGHDVFFFRLDQFCKGKNVVFRSASYKKILGEELKKTFLQQHKIKPFDLFFTYLTDQDVEKETINEIKKFSVLMVNFSCNNTHQFYITKEIAPLFDYNLHSEKFAADKFKEIGANPIWFQLAANPKYYYPIVTQRTFDITFIGANYAKRAYYLNYLLENHLTVNCFGPNWLKAIDRTDYKYWNKEILRYLNLIQSFFVLHKEKRLNLSCWLNDYDFQMLFKHKFREYIHPPIIDDDIVLLVNSSKINLGFSEVFIKDNNYSIITQSHLHLREFEIPMCGGLYITNSSDELFEFYEPEKEIITFNSEKELFDKTQYYLTHEAESEKVSNAAYLRAISCHTYHIRLKELFKDLNLK